MARTIKLQKAIALSLGGLSQPVVTKYQLGCIIFRLYLSKTYQGQDINLRLGYPNSRAFRNAVSDLVEDGIIIQNANFSADNVYNILGKDIRDAKELVCVVDPFSYVSHLSAMEYHGLTNRISKIIYISSPSVVDWKEFAQERMLRDLGDNLSSYLEVGFPGLRRLSLKKVGDRHIVRHSSVHLGAYKNVQGKELRVATLGRTFLDMVRDPDLCGGIYHVIEIYEEFAHKFSNLIIDEVNDHGKPVDKVRVGYLLNELCSVENPVIDSWTSFVQRGGSRKLVSNQEYSSKYSEKWCLSINY